MKVRPTELEDPRSHPPHSPEIVSKRVKGPTLLLSLNQCHRFLGSRGRKREFQYKGLSSKPFVGESFPVHHEFTTEDMCFSSLTYSSWTQPSTTGLLLSNLTPEIKPVIRSVLVPVDCLASLIHQVP